jgi:hypothetical protein
MGSMESSLIDTRNRSRLLVKTGPCSLPDIVFPLKFTPLCPKSDSAYLIPKPNLEKKGVVGDARGVFVAY